MIDLSVGGTNRWKRCMAEMVTASRNLYVRSVSTWETCCCVMKSEVIEEMLDLTNWNMSRRVRIWCETTLCRLALAVALFTVPPIPSQAFLPCEVVKKCHSALMWKSFSWCKRFKKLDVFYIARRSRRKNNAIFSDVDMRSSAGMRTFRKAYTMMVVCFSPSEKHQKLWCWSSPSGEWK